jgi:tetratricopeptide (TPR) repeat protein
VAVAALAAIALAPLLAGACRRPGPPAAGPFPGAPVILISIDTLRSDHLPVYGYRGVETPAIDALARDSVLVERAYSQVPLTLPSHASILSGRLPAETGVRDNIGYHFDAARLAALPVALRQAGYATGGAVSAFVLRGETGIGGGFDYYDSQVDVRLSGALGQSQRAGGITEQLLLGWLRQAAAGPKPCFAFLHLYEPHSPYTPPEPFASRYRAAPYDGEIATADAIAGDFLREVRRLGLYDRAIVVLLSDHGEGLGDHGEREHGLLLYREALQVPLLLKLPHSLQHGRRVHAPAQLVDVYPTLLTLLGLPVPPGLPGRSLFALDEPDRAAQAPRDIFAETFYPRLHFGWSELSSLVRDRFHYIQGPDPELYDLAADPGERTDVRLDQRPAFTALRQRIQDFRHDLAAPAAADEETRRRLASLGYAGGTLALSAGERLPDPKAQIGTLQALTQAMELFAAQRYGEAVPAFRAVLAGNPRMVDAWEHLGRSLERLGRLGESLAAYQQALKLSGGTGQIAIAAGYVLLEMKRYDEAREHAELARREDPVQAESLIGAIALARQRPEEAAAAARAALAAGEADGGAGAGGGGGGGAAGPGGAGSSTAALGAAGGNRGGGINVGPLVLLAQARAGEGRLAEGLALLDQASQELTRRAPGQSYPGLSFARGDILARMGRNALAEQAFLREMKDNPSEPRAFASLAMLYASEGRSQEALGALQRLIESGRSPASYGMAVRTLRVLGDPADAQTLLREGIRLFPGSPELAELSRAP